MDSAFLNIVMYVVVNLLLFSSWYFLLFRKKYYLSFIDRLIGTFVLGLTQIIATEMLLGVVFKQLFAVPLFLFNISISLVVLVLAIKSYHLPFTIPPSHPFPKGGMVGFGGIIKDIFLEFKDEAVRIFRIIKGDIVLFCIFSLFFISVCRMVFLGYLFPSYTWDALWYHLPSVGYVIQSGAIQENPVYSFIDVVINILPKNIELFFIWNTIFLKSDIIADLSQLPFTIAGVFTIYSIAIKLRLKEKYALYSSFLFFFTPLIILQSTTNYIDIAVSVLFLIAINFLMYDNPENSFSSEAGLIHLRERKIPILLAGLATGILLGSKGSGPLFVVILSSAIIIQELIKHFNASKTKPAHRGYFIIRALKPYLIYFIVPAFLMGAYWYIKNLVLYNNPLYTTEFSFLNITIFKGLFKGIIDPAPEVINNLTPLAKLFYVWLEKVEYYLYDSRLSGFGPIWFILFLPSLVFSLIYAINKRKYSFLFISAILIITFLVYPRNWYTRYVIYIVALGALSFGVVLNYFNKRANALKIVALLFAGYVFFTANSPCIMPEKIKEFLLLPANERTIARHAPFNIDLHARQDYGYWIWISNNILKGDTLAYTFEPLFLTPLWNSEFSNNIAHIRSDTYNEWLKNLKKNNVTYVLIRTNSAEDRWIDKEKKLLHSIWWLGGFKERFKVVYTDKNYKIVKLRKG